MNIDDLAAQLKERVTALSPAEQDELSRAVAKAVPEKWVPQPGPQTECYFSQADEVLFGGAAGGGKSALLIGYGLNAAQNGVIFRNGLGNVRDLENYAMSVMGHRNGFNGQFHYWDRGNGKSLEFGSLEQPGSEQNWQGRRRDFMGFDEAAQMLKSRVQFVLGWSGSAKSVRTRVIYATNPPLSDDGNWLITWFAPWLDPMFANPAKAGELRWFVNDKEGDPIWVDGPGSHDRGDGVISTAKSRTFIPSSLNDNRFLRDTDYRSRVEALPEPMRSAMLNGNFMAARVDHANQLLPSAWVQAAQARWTPDGGKAAMISLGVDVAGGGPDREVMAALHAGNWYAELKSHQGVDTKDGRAVAGRIVAVQRNGAPVGIDMTGGWGGGAKVALSESEVDIVSVVFSSVTGAIDRQTGIQFGNLRAEMYWNFRRALDLTGDGHVERIALPPGAKILAEATAIRWVHRGGKIWVESKDDIRKRLGVSTDQLDAIIIAWHIRGHGIAKAKRGGRRHETQGTSATADPFEIDGFN